MSRYKILVADKLSAEGVQLLRSHEEVDVEIRHGLSDEDLALAAADADAILVRSSASITARVLASAEQLKVVGRAGIGIDNIDLQAATARGVLVMNVPDANANTTAEHALSLMLALTRNIPAADRSVRQGLWERSRFIGSELSGKLLGVLGGGNIGLRVAHRAQGLGLQVIVHDPYLAEDALKGHGIPVVPLHELAERADIISIHVPLLDSTRHLVGADLIKRMKDGVRIVNCARGGIIDEQALLEALKSGKVRGAALDVFEQEPPPSDHPLFELDNVVLTPHLGASTSEAQTRASVDICQQVLDYLLRGEIRNALNLPRIPSEVMDELAPWMELARRLGRLLAGTLEEPCGQLEIGFQGRLSGMNTAPITRSLLAGFLQPALDVPVNMVNAPTLAENRGILIEERKSERIRDFASMLSARAICGKSIAEVAGTLFGHRQLRIVRIGGFSLEAIPEGHLMIVRNHDTPGAIGRIGSLLGESRVNIRAMHLAPPRRLDGQALSVFNVAPPPSAELLKAVLALPDVVRVVAVDLSG